MRGVQDFLRDSVPAMIDYIKLVSTPTSESPPSLGDDINRHDRISVANALRHRTKTMTILDRESVPILPHLLDVPRHLAIITSAVIRGSRELSTRPRTGDDTDLAVDEFCSKCYEIEQEALLRVSQLAARLASASRRPSLPGSTREASLRWETGSRVPPAPITEITSTITSAGNGSDRQRRHTRPSTAPSPTSPTSPSSSSRRQPLQSDSATDSRVISHVTPDEGRNPNGQNTRPAHLKAPSTDSVPSPFSGRDTSLPSVRQPPQLDTSPDPTDEQGKRKKGLLRGILRRQ